MIILSFSGKAGAGKDTAANLLTERMLLDGFRVVRLSFAGKLKDACCTMFGWDREKLNSDPFYKEGGLGGWVPRDKPGVIPRTWNQVKEDVDHDSSLRYENFVELDTDPYCMILNMSRRVIMQKFGTECMRNGMDKNFWIKLIQADIESGLYDQADVGIISDARFANELEFTKDNSGMTILIDRIDTSSTLTQHVTHASEQEWQTYGNAKGWDIPIINDVTAGLADLGNKVIRSVYTKIVQTGMNQFNFAVQRNLVLGSMFVEQSVTSVVMPTSVPAMPMSAFEIALERVRETTIGIVPDSIFPIKSVENNPILQQAEHVRDDLRNRLDRIRSERN